MQIEEIARKFHYSEIRIDVTLSVTALHLRIPAQHHQVTSCAEIHHYLLLPCIVC